MKVRVFRQRVTQAHEAEEEINNWLAEMEGKIKVKYVEQSTYMTEANERGTPAFIISVWYNDED
jgi:uncharacterized protein YueI